MAISSPVRRTENYTSRVGVQPEKLYMPGTTQFPWSASGVRPSAPSMTTSGITPPTTSLVSPQGPQPLIRPGGSGSVRYYSAPPADFGASYNRNPQAATAVGFGGLTSARPQTRGGTFRFINAPANAPSSGNLGQDFATKLSSQIRQSFTGQRNRILENPTFAAANAEIQKQLSGASAPFTSQAINTRLAAARDRAAAEGAAEIRAAIERGYSGPRLDAIRARVNNYVSLAEQRERQSIDSEAAIANANFRQSAVPMAGNLAATQEQLLSPVEQQRREFLMNQTYSAPGSTREYSALSPYGRLNQAEAQYGLEQRESGRADRALALNEEIGRANLGIAQSDLALRQAQEQRANQAQQFLQGLSLRKQELEEAGGGRLQFSAQQREQQRADIAQQNWERMFGSSEQQRQIENERENKRILQDTRYKELALARQGEMDKLDMERQKIQNEMLGRQARQMPTDDLVQELRNLELKGLRLQVKEKEEQAAADARMQAAKEKAQIAEYENVPTSIRLKNAADEAQILLYNDQRTAALSKRDEVDPEFKNAIRTIKAEAPNAFTQTVGEDSNIGLVMTGDFPKEYSDADVKANMTEEARKGFDAAMPPSTLARDIPAQDLRDIIIGTRDQMIKNIRNAPKPGRLSRLNHITWSSSFEEYQDYAMRIIKAEAEKQLKAIGE